MYWKAWYLVGNVFALNEHITVCPSSISVQLPSVESVHTVQLTLTNSGTETATVTLLPNDTFNSAREREWRAGEAYAPPHVIMLEESSTTTTTKKKATTTKKSRFESPVLSEAGLQFHNADVEGHGIMISHGNLEVHPDLEAITSDEAEAEAKAASRRGGGRGRKWSRVSRGKQMDWRTVVMRREIEGIPAICGYKSRMGGKHAEILCPPVLTQTIDCQGRAFDLDNGYHIELRFPSSCTDDAVTRATSVWTSMLGGLDVEPDEILLVQGEYLRGGGEGAIARPGGVMAAGAAGGAASAAARIEPGLSFDPAWPNEWQYGFKDYAYPFLMINATTQWSVLAHYPIASNPTVLVIDTYAQLDHEDLMDNYAVNEIELNGLPGVDDDGDGVIDNIYGLDGANMALGDPTWSGSISHGTSVAGLIAAKPGNDVGTAGVAPQLRILPCGTGNSTMSMLATIACMDWAVGNAKRFNIRVINHSYTGVTYSAYQASTFAKTQDMGMIHTVATGNVNLDMDETQPPTPILYLATEGYYSMIGIGRLDKLGRPAPSGYSTEWATFYMPGEMTVILPPDGDYIALGSGTSFAAPTAAGVIGSMLTIRPELDIFDVLWILENSVVKLRTLSDLCKWGGFVNASRALEAAQGTWIKPTQEANRYVTLQPGESRTVDFTVTLRPEGAVDPTVTSRTAYIAVLGANETRLSGVYKMGEVPVTVTLAA